MEGVGTARCGAAGNQSTDRRAVAGDAFGGTELIDDGRRQLPGQHDRQVSVVLDQDVRRLEVGLEDHGGVAGGHDHVEVRVVGHETGRELSSARGEKQRAPMTAESGRSCMPLASGLRVAR